MAGSAFVKIDRLYEREMRAKARAAEKDKPIIHCGILDFFNLMTGFEPTAHQVRFLLDTSQFVVARWSRQSGKSLCLTLICLYGALSGSNRRIAILAPSLRQSRAMIRRASSFLPKLPRNALEGRALKTKLEFSNGSAIEAFPNSPETVRGLTLDLLIVDEASYIEDDSALYDAIVFALGTTNGRFIATSTPGSRDSLFYEMCMDDDLYGDFSRNQVSFHDALEPNGPLKKGILEKLERQMREDPWRWQREMLAEVSEDEEAYFSYSLIDSAVGDHLEYVKDLNKLEADSMRG